MALGKKFRDATRIKVKASIMIEGLSGLGKSGLALAIGTALTTPDKVFAIDTENQSLDLFAGLKLHTGNKLEGFKKVDLTPEDGYAPSHYEALRNDAVNSGAEVVIMDSISHMWTRKGGLLDAVTRVKNNRSGRDFNAWNDPEIIKEKNIIFDVIRSTHAHTIVTVRVKEKFAMQAGDNGKTTVVSMGEQQIQQEGLKYEPDLVLRMVKAGTPQGDAPVALVTKSRYELFTVGVTYEFDKKLLDSFGAFIREGVDADTLLEQQRLDYIEGIKNYCGENRTRKSIWKNLKEAAGFGDSKIEDIPLNEIRQLYVTLTLN